MLYVLGRLGWYGAPFATQALILLSVVSGPIIGGVVLWSVGEADLVPSAQRRAKWFACLALVGPLLTFLIMSWVANIIWGFQLAL
jgi:hypothetical protein